MVTPVVKPHMRSFWELFLTAGKFGYLKVFTETARTLWQMGRIKPSQALNYECLNIVPSNILVFFFFCILKCYKNVFYWGKNFHGHHYSFWMVYYSVMPNPQKSPFRHFNLFSSKPIFLKPSCPTLPILL